MSKGGKSLILSLIKSIAKRAKLNYYYYCYSKIILHNDTKKLFKKVKSTIKKLFIKLISLIIRKLIEHHIIDNLLS